MKLNINCMKHIVDYCIEKQTISSNGVVNDIVIRKLLSDISELGYNDSDIWYSLRKLKELSYIITDNGASQLRDGSSISDVTISGHKFAKIEEPKITDL